MKILDRILYGWIGKIVLILFVVSLFSLTGVWKMDQTSVTGASETTTTTVFGLSLLASFYSLDGFQVTMVTHTALTGGSIDPGTGSIIGLVANSTTDPLSIQAPSFTFVTYILIGVGLVFLGAIIAQIVKKNKVFGLIALALVAAGSIIYFIKAGSAAFENFHFIINKEGTEETIVNFALPYVSTGLILIVLDALTLLHCLYVLIRKKAIKA